MPDGHWLVMPQVSTVDDLFGTHTLLAPACFIQHILDQIPRKDVR